MEPEKSFLYDNNFHQTWVEVSSSAIAHNSAYYKSLIGQSSKLAVVIKGNGYGHGLHEMATICEKNDFIDWVCVAQLSEALALNSIGIKKPILVLGYNNANPENAINTNIEFMVDNLAYVTMLNAIGKKHAYQFKVHVKIDTGLSRLGVFAHEAVDFIKKLLTLPYISINGIFSHFASSDSNPIFTQQQITLFINTLNDLFKNNIHLQNIHMSNTGALNSLEYPPLFNFFRAGLGVYGLGAKESILKPAMTWKTRIMNIKTIPANSYVSYADTYKTGRITRTALLPIGYFDGYNLRLSNKSSVLINGNYAPVLGRVAMNMTIVDVTDIDAHVHDEVILLGNYPGVSIRDLSLAADIKNMREIITNINPVLPRIIVQ